MSEHDNIIAGLGEDGLVARIAANAPTQLPRGWLGIGDDAAVIPVSYDRSLILSTDLLVENTHFTRETATPEAVGHKALACNLSDIAAMGGKPTSVLLSLGVPALLPVAWVDRFMQGFSALAEQFGVKLIGGDTVHADSIVINITIVGEAHPNEIKLRSSAQKNDIIAVTGNLGDSEAGLRALVQLRSDDEASKSLIKRHLQPMPHVNEGRWLAKQKHVHAMMDVSDGIATDLPRLLKASKLGAELQLDSLPLSAEFLALARQHNWNAAELAFISGEEYCLLLTVAEKDFARVQKDFQKAFDHSLFAIGKITAAPELKVNCGGKPYQLAQSGYSHF